MSHRPSPDPKSSMWALIAYYLRFCRLRRKLTGELLGEIIGCSKSTVSRLETGALQLTPEQAATLDRAWDTGGIFGFLVWYATLGHDPDWFRQYVDLECRASVIKTWQVDLVPGLLQTPDYARACLMSGNICNVEEALDKRLSRQSILDKENAPTFWFLISENSSGDSLRWAECHEGTACAHTRGFTPSQCGRAGGPEICWCASGPGWFFYADDTAQPAYGGRVCRSPGWRKTGLCHRRSSIICTTL